MAEAGNDTGLIRLATLEDVASFREITEAAYTVYLPRIGYRPPPMETDFEAHIMRAEVRALERDGQVIGYLLLAQERSAMFVINIAVRPEYQGTGMGRKLLLHAETEARENDCDSMKLYTHVKMTENQALYRRFGYIEVAQRTEAGVNRVYMVKQLQVEAGK